MAMRVGLLVIAILALVAFVAVAFVLPQKRESEAKEAAQALIAGADAAKKQVGTAAEKSGNLAGSGKEVKIQSQNDARHGEMKWIVVENGAIRGWNEKNSLEVTMSPTLSGGKVSWSCRGYPVAAMPASCVGR
jgi:type II secretory pathway pseudopilin PulG